MQACICVIKLHVLILNIMPIPLDCDYSVAMYKIWKQNPPNRLGQCSYLVFILKISELTADAD